MTKKNTVPVEQTTINMVSGEKTVKTVQFGLLPCKPDVCQVCATDHAPEMPHNQRSLYYQYKFYGENDERWPTWLDAMAHCSEDVQRRWKTELLKMGVKLA